MDERQKTLVKACNARYRAKHKEEIRLRNAEYRAKNLNKLKLSKALYHTINKEANNNKAKERYNKNKASYLKTCKAYREANKDKVQSATKAWRIANPERARLLSARKESVRRARKYGSKVIKYERQDIYNRDNGICHICDELIDYNLQWPNPLSFSIDHIIPISKGGEDTPYNVSSSHLKCNMIKHAKVIDVSKIRYNIQSMNNMKVRIAP